MLRYARNGLLLFFLIIFIFGEGTVQLTCFLLYLGKEEKVGGHVARGDKC